jgi:hypothetical protein
MGTDWSSYNLPAIWEMVRSENVCTGADRVLAWEGLADSVREQHRRLVESAENLAAVWSPEQNVSALAFQRMMDDLATSMKETLQCAEDTRSGLKGVMAAFGDAQGTLQTLAVGRAAVSDDWMPRFIDHAEDEYDEKAQQVIRNTESAIADHSTNIKAPALYELLPAEHGGTTAFQNDDPGLSSGNDSGVRATPVPVSIPHNPVLMEPGAGSGSGTSTDPSLGIGPGLSGVTTLPAPTLSGPGILPGQPLGPGGGGLPTGPLGGGPLGAPLGLVPGTSGLGLFPGMNGPAGRGGSAAGRQAVPMRRGLPSGAVIGEGQLGAGRRGVAGGRGTAGQTPLGAAGNRRDRRADGSDPLIDGDPDEQWRTFEGVMPVIMPDTAPVRHDPGPGVLGLDR